MKAMGVAVLTIAVALIAVPPVVCAHGYYVISDMRGHKAVTNGVPEYGWYVESGPYPTADAAGRATGTGDGPQWHYNVHLSGGNRRRNSGTSSRRISTK